MILVISALEFNRGIININFIKIKIDKACFDKYGLDTVYNFKIGF